MTERWLEEAARALRGTSGKSNHAASTRARILRGLDQRRPRRWHVAWMLPALAILGGGTALAANLDDTARWFDRAGQWLGILPGAHPPPAEATPTVRDERATPRVSATQAIQELPPDVGDETSVEEVTPPASTEPAGRAAVVPSAFQRSEPHLAEYRAAHEAHFRDRDFAGALERWDHYLRVAPRGSFASEARYNRAIALLRLGRKTEAAVALQPFADGRYGGYRQVDARKLLDAMPAGSDPAVPSVGGRGMQR